MVQSVAVLLHHGFLIASKHSGLSHLNVSCGKNSRLTLDWWSGRDVHKSWFCVASGTSHGYNCSSAPERIL